MKNTISLLLVSLLLLTGHSLFSQDENYDAVYLMLTKEYTVNSDGSIDYRYVKKQKLQTYRSFHSLYGESFIIYHPDYQSLKINEAYTLMADGKKNPSPPNAFNEVLPGFSANAPAFNKLREMVVTHSGTERNAVLNLDYTLHSQKGFYPCLMGNELLSEPEPVKELTLRIRIPAGTALRFSMLNSEAKPEITTEKGQQVYTWKLANVPAISAEDFQSGGYDLYPRLIFSTSGDRNSLYADFMKQEAFSYERNGEMKEAVAIVNKENKEKMNQVLKLQEKVVNEFRLFPVPMKYTGFRCRTPKETWMGNGGTLLEKAVLLSALLKESGFEADPVFSIRTGQFDKSVGSLLDVEEVFVRTTVPDEGLLYLSVNTLNVQDMRFVMPDRIFVELQKPTVAIRKTPSVTSRIRLEGTFSVSEKMQLSGTITCSETDGANPYLLLLRDKNKAKSLFGGGIASSDLKEPVTVIAGKDESSMSFAVQKEKPLTIDSDYCFFTLPEMNNGADGLGIHLLPKNRNTPLEVSSALEEENDFTLQLPPGLKLFLPSDKCETRNGAGAFLFELKQENEKVVIHKSLKIQNRRIGPEQYADFKNLMDQWNADRYREIVLEKK